MTDYEIWNEPNNGQFFWKPKPDAARYADMYLRARAAIRRVDPRATVLVGGLVAHPSFVRAMYAARPGLHGNLDALGWHAYAPRVDGLLGAIRDLRATLELEGEPDLDSLLPGRNPFKPRCGRADTDATRNGLEPLRRLLSGLPDQTGSSVPEG